MRADTRLQYGLWGRKSAGTDHVRLRYLQSKIGTTRPTSSMAIGGDSDTYPEVWNIHQTPATNANMTVSGTSGYPRPTQFRLHAFGKIGYQLPQNGGSIPNFGATVTNFGNVMGGVGQAAKFQPMDYDDAFWPRVALYLSFLRRWYSPDHLPAARRPVTPR